MVVGVDPKVDYAFKYLFGRESSLPILVNVLESVLHASLNEKIRELVLLNPFNPKEAPDDKSSILDIKARDNSGRLFNIEMQMLSYPAYDQRIVYYASRLHQQQLHEGQEYSALRPTISISFLNHVLFPEVESHHLQFGLLEQTHRFALNHDLEFHILELPKFAKSAEQLTGDLDNWLYFLRHAEKMDAGALPPSMEQSLVRRALEDLKVLSQTDIEREHYESRRKALMDHNSMMGAARREGLEQGFAKGLEKGIQKGDEKARYDEKIDRIQSYEQLLNRPVTAAEQLAARSLEELTELATNLFTELRAQRSSSR